VDGKEIGKNPFLLCGVHDHSYWFYSTDKKKKFDKEKQ
jgi:hypothetical protein